MKVYNRSVSEDTPGGGFTWRQVQRLRFLKWLEENKVTDVRNPQTPIPKQVINVEPGNVTSMQQFIDRHRRRGPYKKD